MLTIQNVSYGNPQKELFEDISFTIEKGQHCALIGQSGSGKTTLANLIMTPETYMFKGSITREGWRLGYVSQFLDDHVVKTTRVMDYVAQDFIALHKQIDDICLQMATAQDVDPLLETYQNLLDHLEAIGGDDYESLIIKKLNMAGLGGHADLNLGQLSGGEFKLVQIIKEMLGEPDLLVMDEPDVYLDFDNLNGLRQLMNTYKGALLVITHSRYLLNHCFNKILHVENCELQAFDGSYNAYHYWLLKNKIELQELSFEDEEEIARNEAIIDRLRFIATYNTEAARGRSLKARVKIQERLEARKIKAPFVQIKEPHIDMHLDEPLNLDDILRVDDLTIAFDETLLEAVSFAMASQEKIALVGLNGTGKTSLFRAITGNHPQVTLHPQANLAYVSQMQSESLPVTWTLKEVFYNIDIHDLNIIKGYLYDYGFKAEDTDRTVATLSGGEKNLLQLAQAAALKANLLLLDEPTSHLDTYAQLALESAIKKYPGAVLMISHDYFTISECMDHVLLIEDKALRKLTLKKFRRMVYKRYFERDYLMIEQEKKALETTIARHLAAGDFKSAKAQLKDLETLINS